MLTPTLVFLPGTLCDMRVWREVYDALRGDYPCAGFNYERESAIAKMAGAVLERFSGPLLPVGLSMGGIVGLEMWRQAPHRIPAMALFGTNPGPDTPERCAGRQLQLATARSEGIATLASRTLAPAYFGDAAAQPSLSATVISMAEAGGERQFAAQSAALAGRADSWPMLPTLDIPLLVAAGDADMVVAPMDQQRTASLAPRAQYATIAGAGHLAPLEQPALCASALRSWLDSIGVKPLR